MRRTRGDIYASLDADLWRDPPVAGPPIKVGDRVTRRPISFTDSVDGGKTARKMAGTVIYVHPQGRYHVVEFGQGAKAVRESFRGIR
nr:MAG TPA: hypothetical protein [Caudoviricetes sp.]